MRLLRHPKKAMLRALRACNAFAVISSLLLSPVAHALQIKLGSAMNLRTLSNDGDALTKVGVLGAGSVVEIPNKYAVKNRKTGAIDATASFNNWLSSAGFKKAEINKKVRDPKRDFYFPVTVVSATNREGRKLVGKTHLMALRVLAKSRGRLTVKTKALVYKSPDDDAPIQPADPDEASTPAEAESTAAPAAAPQAPAAAAEETPEAQAPCVNCSLAEAESAPTVPEASTDAFSEIASEIDDRYLPDSWDDDLAANRFQKPVAGFYAGGATCERFISADGKHYGDAGKEVLTQITKYPVYMSNNNGVTRTCKNFANFSNAQKRHYWVWFWGALAWQESKCGAVKSAGHLNPGGRASVGMYHIEASERLRRSRGSFCNGDPKTLRVNTSCAIGDMTRLLRSGQGPFSSTDQQWGPLKRSEAGDWVRIGKKSYFIKSVTKKLVRQYEACGND
jgi:hypothetical protein